MIELTIPGRGILQVEHLVCDVNGTLAKDGHLLDKVARLVAALKDRLTVHLLTADTYGRQAAIDLQLGLRAVRLQPGGEAEQKADYVRALGAEHVIAVGQGANDAAMLKTAAIGIAVLGDEGLAVEALVNADLVAASIYDALNLLEFPTRLVATLRR
ncbi:MAG: HAD family hydrolase [Anaerolineales bacterium]|nr:HAD family hydrolase [Anaerolineales bacterium]